MQTPIKTCLMRGGTSRGPFFVESDLPADVATRDRVLLAVMGSPHARQIDGLGGAHPLTSKVGIVRRGTRPGVDLDFLFAQLQSDKETVDTTPNCGNMLAAVVPFALERGLIPARGDTTTVRVLTLNTGMQCDITVQTPGGSVIYDGDARIDGCPGSSAPITIEFLDTAGSVCSGLLPTGNVKDVIDGIEVTCIDNGMPVVCIDARDLGLTGHESPAELEANTEARARIEAIRLHAGPRMNLGDVRNNTVPKMSLLAPAKDGGLVSTRTFIPHRVHESIGVLGAVSVATACMLPGSVANAIAGLDNVGSSLEVEVEHPTGFFTVQMEVDNSSGTPVVTKSALLRTARMLMSGSVYVLESAWENNA